MQAMTAPTSAREIIFGAEPMGALPEDINLNAFRYFVQFGWEVLSVDSLTIPQRRLLRGEITPCRTVPRRRNYYEIREGERIPGSEVMDPVGKDYAWASERVYAYYEANNLIALEEAAERKTGLYEIKSLWCELGDRLYREKDLTRLFFPDWPDLPEKHEDAEAYLRARIDDLKGTPLRGGDIVYMDLVFQIGRELLEAIESANRIQRHLLTVTHSLMKLEPKDEGYKKKYDNTDYEMLRRTGLPEIHESEYQTAKALDKLSDKAKAGETGLADLVAVLRQQAESQGQLNEVIAMLLVQNSQPTMPPQNITPEPEETGDKPKTGGKAKS